MEFHTYYRWTNPGYIEFMIQIMSFLEPRYFQVNTIILNELEEHNEVIYFTDGKFKVGFEVNGHEHYVIRYQNSSKNATSIGMDIGQYGCTFNKSSRFNFKT